MSLYSDRGARSVSALLLQPDSFDKAKADIGWDWQIAT